MFPLWKAQTPGKLNEADFHVAIKQSQKDDQLFYVHYYKVIQSSEVRV